MSKIICDVCGTSYPETATQCPICGCVRSGNPITVTGDTNEAEVRPAASYTYVKGGRFSKSNVKKRNAGKPIYNAEPIIPADDEDQNPKNGEKGLIAAVIFLLLAIVAVVIYIALQIFGVKLPFGTGANPNGNGTQTQQTTSSTETTALQIPCQSLDISNTVIEFNKKGAVQLLNVKALPANHTDEILFSSKDSNVATVDKNGKVTAVGHGETVIIVECGEKTAQCRVVCSITEGTTPPQVTYTKEDLKFVDNGWGYDYTLKLSEKSFNPYRGKIPTELVTFTSNDESVATVDGDGLITFIGKGRAVITAKYNDWKIECVLHLES